jgi:probable F420-dependent oxidoreductase
MQIGLFGINMNACAEPQTAARVAQRAESLGFESLWTGEHVVLPDPREAPSPAEPETPFLHPPALLSYLAGVTERIKFGTGITLIAQRNPVVLAKEMATVDVLSAGRVLFGIGAGYLHQEFAALGVDFASRGARTDEYIDVLRALWNQPMPEFEGEYVKFSAIQSQPRPVQAGGPPIIVGGASPAALRRAVTHGNGWYGFAMDVDTTKKVLERIELAKARHERDPALGDLPISITPAGRPTKDMIEEYAALGVDRLIPILGAPTQAAALENVDKIAEQLL